jgi:hypothetical protein
MIYKQLVEVSDEYLPQYAFQKNWEQKLGEGYIQLLLKVTF